MKYDPDYKLKPGEVAPGITLEKYRAARNGLLCFGLGLLLILIILCLKQ